MGGSIIRPVVKLQLNWWCDEYIIYILSKLKIIIKKLKYMYKKNKNQ